MGIINKIRERSGLAVGIIAVGLILFLVGGDLLSINSVLLGGGKNYVGRILDKEISLEEFQATLSQVTYQYRLNTGKSPEASVMPSLRSQAWQKLIQQTAYRSEYNKLGLSVSEEELIDMVQGDHVRDDLKAGFKNEETNEFDKQKLQEYLQKVSDLAPQQQAVWYNYEQELIPTRLREKYTNLLLKSTYSTRAELEFAHREESRRIDLRYLYVPYRNIPDSNFSVSDSEARDYLESRAYKYQREESRGAYYCSFPIEPSAQDTAYVREEMESLRIDLQESSEDSLLVGLHSDASNAYRTYRPDELPEPLSELSDSLYVGQIVGPLVHKGKLVMYKISATEEGEEEYMRASHILVKPEEEEEDSKTKAHKKAEEVLEKLKKGAAFKEMAVEYSLDPSAANGGDLGWFSRGDMVAPFEEAAFSAPKAGLIHKVIDTEFGSHIIKVTELPSTYKYVVSSIEKEIIARDETRDQAYQQAVEFVSICDDTASFVQAIDTMNLLMERAPRVRPLDTRIGSFSDVRSIVQWLFNEAEPEDVSEVYELDRAFFVAVMTTSQPKGLANYPSIAEEMRTQLMNQKKATQIIDTLESQPSDLSLDDLVQLLPSGYAYVYSMNALRFSDRSLRSVGDDPMALGSAFALKKVGDRSGPLATENGILILELVNRKEEEEIDVDEVKERVQRKREGSLYQDLSQSIEQLAEIEDQRHKFY